MIVDDSATMKKDIVRSLPQAGDFRLGLSYRVDRWDPASARSVVHRLDEGHVSVEIRIDRGAQATR